MPDKKANAADQDNIGYENTTTRNSVDDRENDRTQTTDPIEEKGKNPNPEPGSKGDTYGDNSGGLRAESSAKTVSGNTGKGKSVKSGKVDTKGKKKGND